MAIFFFSIEMGIKNRREMRSVGLSTDFRMYVSFSVHEIVTLLIYFFMRIISVSGPQTPQTVFDADFEGLTSNAELYIFNQEDSQE